MNTLSLFSFSPSSTLIVKSVGKFGTFYFHLRDTATLGMFTIHVFNVLFSELDARYRGVLAQGLFFQCSACFYRLF